MDDLFYRALSHTKPGDIGKDGMGIQGLFDLQYLYLSNVPLSMGELGLLNLARGSPKFPHCEN